jgi:hypothetical protein
MRVNDKLKFIGHFWEGSTWKLMRLKNERTRSSVS